VYLLLIINKQLFLSPMSIKHKVLSNCAPKIRLIRQSAARQINPIELAQMLWSFQQKNSVLIWESTNYPSSKNARFKGCSGKLPIRWTTQTSLTKEIKIWESFA